MAHEILILDIHPRARRRQMRSCLVALAAVLVLVAGACGGDDDDGGDATPTSADEQQEASGAGGDAGSAAPAAEVQTCLESEGIEVALDDAPPTELDESRGVADRLQLTIREPEPGVGTITWYGSDDQAAEGLEGAGLVAGEGRSYARVGLAVYSVAGADETVTAIEECLSA